MNYRQEARMQHLHRDSHFRLAIAVPQASDGYVDALLGLARNQIMGRQLLISRGYSRQCSSPVPRKGAVGSRTNLRSIFATR